MSTNHQCILRQERLFALFDVAKRSGAQFSPISLVNEYVVNRRAAIFLRHDVHGVSLPELIRFARDESKRNIFGTYLFMTPDYPLTQPHYSFEEQCDAMQRIGELGHETGLHIDPFFLIQSHHLPLDQILSEIIRLFERRGISIKIGNIHGNSKFRHLDANGFETSFDLFEEIARQPDFPDLKNVPFPTAQIIRDNRVSLKTLGFAFWCDMPLWSGDYNFIVTNFITDNRVGKKSEIEFLVQPQMAGQYKLADSQPPGSYTPSKARQLIPLTDAQPANLELDPGVSVLSFDAPEVTQSFKSLSHHPVQFLVHPQHYL